MSKKNHPSSPNARLIGSHADIWIQISFLPFANCERSYAENGDFRVYFEKPPEAIFIDDPDLGEDFEFYRLPFPNDMRVNDGEISLKGHFEPGEVLPAPLPERVNAGVVERACAYAEAVLFFTQVWATRNQTQH